MGVYSDKYIKNFPVSWSQLQQDCRALALELIGHGPWDGIVAVTRGGMVPAAIVARELDIHLIETLGISSYDWQKQDEPEVLKIAGGVRGGKGWLVIDDLVDTGSTARVIRKLLPLAHLAVVYAKPEGKPLVDSFVTAVAQDTWVLFPWDSEPHFIAPLFQQHGPKGKKQ